MKDPDAYDRLLAVLERARRKGVNSSREDFRLTSHWPPPSVQVVDLFGKAYWWDRDPGGQLTLRPAAWISKTSLPAR